jgi:beta-1,4-mannosyltransferase
MPNQADSNVFMEVLDLFDLHDLGQFEILLQCLCALVFVWFISIMLWRPRKRPSMRSVAVLVLGDVGRSPRMMYHAESFAKSGFETFVVGYEGE